MRLAVRGGEQVEGDAQALPGIQGLFQIQQYHRGGPVPSQSHLPFPHPSATPAWLRALRCAPSHRSRSARPPLRESSRQIDELRVVRPFVCENCVRVYIYIRACVCARIYMRMHLYSREFAFVYIHKRKCSFLRAYACICVRAFACVSSRGPPSWLWWQWRVLFSAQYAALAPTKETPSLVPSSCSRLADILLPHWSSGCPAALDVSVISPLQQLTLAGAATSPRHVLHVGVR